MYLILKTEPQFLERRFSYLEKSLLGQWKQRSDPTRSDYWIRFSFQPQPLISLEKRPAQPKQQRPASISNQAAASAPPAAAKAVFPEEKIFSGLNSSFWTAAANWAMAFLMLAATVVLVVVYGPQLYYAVFGSQSEKLAANSVLDQDQQTAELEDATPLAQMTPVENQDPEQENKTQVEGVRRYLPEKDASLPEGDWIIIPRIGVHTRLQRTAESQEALETGVWWVPDFALPGELNRPMIVAGHRYGWQWWWKTDYWKYHSFYKLPELEVGDQVEVISDQRKWVYEIYASEEGQEITGYQADLILYTCKFLNSPIRFFKYANLKNK